MKSNSFNLWLRSNYIHHGIAAVINNPLHSRVEFGAGEVVPGVILTVPGAGRQAARVLHVYEALCQHDSAILYNQVRDVWHRVAVAARS